MSDNVTPFRRPKPVRPQQRGGLGLKTHRGKVVLVHLLTVAAFVLNLMLPPPWSLIGMAVAIAAIVLATSNRGQAMPWANTHHEHAVRTLVIGYAVWLLGSALGLIHGSLTIASFYVYIAVTVWASVRALIALVLGVMRKPVPNPRGWLI